MRYNRKLKFSLIAIFAVIVLLVAASYLQHTFQILRLVSDAEKLPLNIKQIAKQFEYIESRSGKPIFRVVALRSVQSSEGTNMLEGVLLEKYDENGKPSDSIRSGRASYQPNTKQVEFNQKVELRLSSGLVLRTEQLKADLNKQYAQVENGYFFESGDYTGRGSRLAYKIQERELEMTGGVEIMQKQGEQVQGFARSDNALMLLLKNQIFLRGHVFGKKGDDTLNAGSTDLVYDFEKKQLNEVRAFDQAVVNSMHSKGNRMLAAGSITVPVSEGRATSFTALGDAQPARLEVHEADKGRRLDAATITGKFDKEGKLASLDSRQNVHFAELPAGSKIQSDTASASFGGGKIKTAVFSERVKFQDEAHGLTLDGTRLTLGFDAAGSADTVQAAGPAVLNSVARDHKSEINLSADRMEGKLAPGGTFEKASAFGNALLKMKTIEDNKLKTIAAGKVVGSFDGAGNLNALSAEQQVHLTLDDGKNKRNTYSDFLESSLASGKLETARQWPNFRFEDEETRLSGETATYQKGIINIPRQKKYPVLTRSDSKTTAQLFVVYENENKLLAQGDVRSEVKRNAAANSNFPTFKDDEPVFIESRELLLADKEAVYSGEVKAHQKNDFLSADKMAIRSESGMTATGRVKTVFYRDSKGQLKKVTTEAPQLVYDRENRTARYSGGVRMVTDDGVVTSKLLDLYFNKDDQIENAVARQNVVIQQGSRTGTGNEADYNFSANRISLTGSQARIVDPAKGKTSGRRLTFFIGDDRILVEG
ncbi:MAG TPA: LPS export ABC transporter periplasmic protein LptC [Acidobacteriota bacterium]|jgi:LPS export ABC transporter protein LptC